MAIAIGITVFAETQEDAVRINETLGRAAIGLVLEGYGVSINYSTIKDDDKAEDGYPKDI